MKKAMKNVLGLTAISAGTAIGAKVVGDIGMGGSYAGAMTGFASMLPAAGSVAGGALVLGQVGQLGNMVKKKK